MHGHLNVKNFSRRCCTDVINLVYEEALGSFNVNIIYSSQRSYK
jgi:hypothetical protein